MLSRSDRLRHPLEFLVEMAMAQGASLCYCPSKEVSLATWQGKKPASATPSSKSKFVLQIRAARKNQTGTKQQQTKRWKTDESAKKIGHAGIEKYRSSFDDTDSGSAEGLVLREDQAVGQVVAAQANFMRIFIERTRNDEHTVGSPEFQNPNPREEGIEQLSTSLNAWEVSSGVKAGTELLCVVRALLKKIKRRVLVGDRVLVSGIDWTDRRGMVEDVLDRRSEITEPPVANVEHLLVIFALDRPKLEPVALSRFLVEAESTGIPFTLILNKADLVQQQVHHHQLLKHLRSPNVGANFEFKSYSPEGLTIMLADALSYDRLGNNLASSRNYIFMQFVGSNVNVESSLPWTVINWSL